MFHFNYLKETERDNLYTMTEISREGVVILKNIKEEIKLTAEEFCGKPWVIEKTRPLDVYKIVSYAYLNIGRQLEQSLYRHQYEKNDGKLLKLIK
jgi:hypothetical protein